MKLHYYQSPIGWLKIGAEDGAIVQLSFCENSEPTPQSDEDPVIRQCCKELNEYFKGDRKSFEVSLSTQGTAFQKRVWEELLTIPYGKTISYAQLAKACDHPKAYRAAGSANGKNAIVIIIPCHRVIASNGSLGGYAYGLEIKKKLLDLENRCFS